MPCMKKGSKCMTGYLISLNSLLCPNPQGKSPQRHAHTYANDSSESSFFGCCVSSCVTDQQVSRNNDKFSLDEKYLMMICITVSLHNSLKNDGKFFPVVRLHFMACIQQAYAYCANHHSATSLVVAASELRNYEANVNIISRQIINYQTNEETENILTILGKAMMTDLLTTVLFLIIHVGAIGNHYNSLQTAKYELETAKQTTNNGFSSKPDSIIVESLLERKTTEAAKIVSEDDINKEIAALGDPNDFEKMMLTLRFSNKRKAKENPSSHCIDLVLDNQNKHWKDAKADSTEKAKMIQDKTNPVKKFIQSSETNSSIESEAFVISAKTYMYEVIQLKADLMKKKIAASISQTMNQTTDNAIHHKSTDALSMEETGAGDITEKILSDRSMEENKTTPREDANTEKILADLSMEETSATPPETEYMYIPSEDANAETMEETATTLSETEYIPIGGVNTEEISNDLSMEETTTTPPETEYTYIPSEDVNAETTLADHSMEETATTLSETEYIPIEGTEDIFAHLSIIPETEYIPIEGVNIEEILTNAAALYDANDFEGMESTLRANMSEMYEISEKFYLVFGIGLALYKKNKHHYAINEFNEAIALLQQHLIPDCISQQSVVHHYVGEALCAQHHYTEAVECFKQSVKLHRCSNGQKSRLQKLYNLKGLSLCSKLYKTALTLRSNDCISEAVEMFKQAIACDDSTVEELIACHSGLGNLFHNNGDYSAAIKEYEKAIELAVKAEDCHHSRGWIYGNIGNCSLALGKKHEGIQYLHQALEYTNTTDPTPASISRALNNLGTGYQAVGDVETAEDYYDQALCQSIYGEDTNGQARAYGNTGNLCMLRKDYERAILHYTEVLNITNDSSVMYVAYHNRACGYYELAENMKEKLICKDKKISFQFEAYGPHTSGGMKSKKETNAKILQMYQQGLADFEKIILNHESKFSTALVSPKGLDLFVCLFESNSKTFRRAQDCAYSLGDHHHALLLAEQCRSRTLAELMMRKRQKKFQKPALHFHSPLTLDQVVSIMHLQEPNVPVAMLSWTGDRLLGWVLVYNGKEVTMDSFEQKPSENMFDGKSLETFLQYCLGQLLSGDLKLYEGKTFNDGIDVVETCKAEVEKGGITEEERIEEEILNLPPIAKLFRLVAEPMEHVIASIDHSRIIHSKRKIILIADSTTKLIPFSSLHTGKAGNDTHVFGDKYTIRFMPSLLTLGIMSQTPPIVIPIPTDNSDACIVGDPITPPFTFKGHEFILSSLPHAKEEAEWVGHYMRAKPLLQNEPTKYVVTSRVKNSSLIHIASHGSALHGFLVLAGNSYDTQSTLMTKISKAMVDDADDLLLFASDVASLSLNAGLVVLSSCDSSRGVIKGDDIQGMARAFLLAGAQSVMTSLWKVPDKSARFFMQFFYRYLLDGHTGSEALNKASCSIRAFVEFSSMIHWSGYQITGKDVTVQQNLVSDEDRMIKKCLGSECSPFPRLEILSALRKSVIEEQSSDIQILCGSADVNLSEPVVDFIIQNPGHFPGGIVWLNGSDIDLLDGQCKTISKILQTNQRSLIVIDSCPSQMIEDALITMNDFPTSSVIMTLLCISGEHLNAQIGTRKRLLTSYNLSALTNLQVTQRIVYHINCSHHLPTRKEEQKSLLYLTSLCHGSPVIIRMMTALIDKYISKCDCPNKGIKQVYEEIKTTILNEAEDDDSEMIDTVSTILDCHIKEHFISVPSIFLLQCLSLFDAMPIPHSVINAISEEIVASSSTENRILPCEIWGNLCSLSLLQRYPSLPKDRHTAHSTNLYYVPVMILDAVWETSLADDSVSKFICGEIINQAMNSVISGCLNSSSPIDCLYLPELIRNVHKHVPNLDILYALQIIAINIRDHHIMLT